MSLMLGLPLGMVSGFYRGRIDNALMRLVDTLLSFPGPDQAEWDPDNVLHRNANIKPA